MLIKLLLLFSWHLSYDVRLQHHVIVVTGRAHANTLGKHLAAVGEYECDNYAVIDAYCDTPPPLPVPNLCSTDKKFIYNTQARIAPRTVDCLVCPSMGRWVSTLIALCVRVSAGSTGMTCR